MNRSNPRDRGLVLPLVLVVAFVLSVVVIGIARYATTNLRYAEVTEQRSNQLAAADAAMSYALNLLRIGRADCIFDSSANVLLPALAEDFNGATGSVTCDTVSGGLDSTPVFAIALFGVGVAPSQYLVRTQAGSVKEINGPVYMERADPAAFQLSNNNGLEIHDANLVHSSPCAGFSESDLPPDVDFVPETFTEICVEEPWWNYGTNGDVFDEPPISAPLSALDTDLTTSVASDTMAVRDGTVPIGGISPFGDSIARSASDPTVIDISGSWEENGNCRVYYPGRYLTPPPIDLAPDKDVYFMSGDYHLDFRDPTDLVNATLDDIGQATDIGTDAELFIDNSTVVAGRENPIAEQVLTQNSDCDLFIDLDANNNPDEYGATFYLSGLSHIYVSSGGAFEINARNQGTATDERYMAVHALCSADASYELDADEWCFESPLLGVSPSTLTAPSPTSGTDSNSYNVVFTQAGQPASLVVSGQIYAPKGEVELDNASSTAQARFRGGIYAARATLQASASAENFEIGVALQEIIFGFRLVATGTDDAGRSTEITSVLEYEYNGDYDTSVDIESWRVCESGC